MVSLLQLHTKSKHTQKTIIGLWLGRVDVC
ncbi:hypothetical protein ALON55S_07068 [Alishewanella longhuensis]